MRTILLASLTTISIAFASSALAETRSAAIEGTPGHTTSGTVSVIEEDGTYTVVFSDDYSLNNAPDPYLSFGSSSAFAKGTDFVRMTTSGSQSYTVPASIDPADYDAVWIWCRRFDVPLAKAVLN